MARRLGDPESLVQALDSANYLLSGTSRAHERRQMLVEQLELIAPTGRVEPMIYVHLASVELQLGRRDAAESAVQRAVALGHERHMMFVLNNALRLVAALALMEGRFSAATELAAQARDAGKQAGGPVPSGYSGEILGARIEQEPDLGLLEVIKNVSGDTPTLGARRAMVAGLYADLGHFDEARAELHTVAAGGFAEVPRDTTFPLAIRYLAESCCQLGEVKLARRLLKEVEPYAGQVLLEGLGTSVQGAADRSLGQLYWTLGRFDDADRSFSAARELELRISAPPLAARSCYWHAKMLASTRSTEVVPRAAMLVDETLRTTGTLGMTLLNRQAHELRDSLRL
jgi:tetratricopeptide (TPR) repeat protein